MPFVVISKNLLVCKVVFRWAHFTRWQGGPFPAHLRRNDRLPQAGKPWCCVLFAACLYVCLSLLVLGQYAATWGKYALLRQSGGGHQAAELGCGRLRRCPVIRPVADLRIYDTLISNGSVVLLKYKLNNVCDADNRPAKGAQRTMIILIYHNIL